MEKRQLDLSKPLLSARRVPKLGYMRAMSGEIVQRHQAGMLLVPPRYQFSDLNHMEQVTKPASVPFMWKHIPSNSKSKSGPIYFARNEQPSVDPSVMQMRAPSPFIRATTTVERSGMSLNETESSPHRDHINHELADALDILLPEETYSVNCSISGLSEDERRNASLLGNISINRQNHDLLMSRFLPAAKAMALESPHYTAVEKQLTYNEPYLVKRFSDAERRPQLKQSKASTEPHVGLDMVDSQIESDDESCDTPSDVSVRSHGFLPKICLKNSVEVISYVKDAKGRSQTPKVPRNEVRKLAKSPSTQPTTPTQLLDKYVQEVSHRRILERKAEAELHKLGKANLDKQIDEYFKSNALHKDSSTTDGNSVRGNISPYRKQRHTSPFREGFGFLGIPKEAETSMARDTNNCTSRMFQDVSPPIEEKLYADFVNFVNESDSNPDEVVKSNVQPVELSKKKTNGPESIPHVMRRLKEFSFSKREAVDSFAARGHKVTEPGINRKPGSFVKVSAEEGLEVAKTQYDIYHTENDARPVASPRPPPLPRHPSESWLWRTLPFIPSKRQTSKPFSPSVKWQTIVMSSRLHDDRKPYSQEFPTNVL